MNPQAAQIHEADLAAIGADVLNSLADAQRSGCAACLRKSNDYVVTVSLAFDVQKSRDMRCEFSALCGECFNAARDFGKTKRS